MPRLSIVIPCSGGAADFDGTLVSALQHRPADCEVLVVHSEPYSDPYRLAGEVEFVPCDSRQSVALINAGVERASGEVIHTLACGIEATEGWTDAAVTHFDDPDVLSVAPVLLAADGQSVAAAGVRWSPGGTRHVAADRRLLEPGAGRLRARIVGPSLEAGFYRRDALVALGGFDTVIGDRLADVDLALALKALGGLNVCEPASRLIAAQPLMSLADKTGFAHARAAERLFWRYAAERGIALSLAAHPWSVLGAFVGSLPEWSAVTGLLGRSVAMLEFGAQQRQARRIALAAERLAELAQLRSTIRLPDRRDAAPSGQPRASRSKRAA